jgi:hypothetical protein
LAYGIYGTPGTIGSNNLIYSTAGTALKPGYTETGDVIGSDPSLVSSSDFQLQSTSPAIDAGADLSLTADYAGNPIYGPPDIGAYEYQPPYAMGTDEITTSASVRVYGDEQFRNKSAPSGGETGDLAITLPGTDRSQWLDVTISAWENSGTNRKTWTESTTVSGITDTLHTVGDLEPYKFYNVKTDNVLGQDITGADCTDGLCRADSQGKIAFTYTGTYSSRTFDVEETDKSEYTPVIAVGNHKIYHLSPDITLALKRNLITLRGKVANLSGGMAGTPYLRHRFCEIM